MQSRLAVPNSESIQLSTMMLRSAAAAAAAVQPRIADLTVPGECIELRPDEPQSKPWLAKVISTRPIIHGDSSEIVSPDAQEVECEWLWHLPECIKDFNIENVDTGLYGSREVILSCPGDESTRDWNPMDSVKWKVYVLPLDQYKSVAANGFQMSITDDGGRNTMTILDPTRCWYFRQSLDAQKRELIPPLPCTIHRPNHEFHQYCRGNSLSLTAVVPSEESVPPRSFLVPENPERQYFRCTLCLRRFESRQGDTQDPQQIDDPKFFRFKSHINQSDTDFVCPYCEVNNKNIEPHQRPNKRARIDNNNTAASESSLWSHDNDVTSLHQSEELQRERKRKQTKYERFSNLFKSSIEETPSTTGGGSSFFSDPQVLADAFFDRFEAYTQEVQLNSKMEHQRLHEIYQNLKRNVNLRRRVVLGDLTIDELIRADVKELAPESLKRRREAEQRRYFEQQVLLSAGPESLRVLRKTHKGLEEVQDVNQRPTRSPEVDQPTESVVDDDTDYAYFESIAHDSSKAGGTTAPNYKQVLSVADIIKKTFSNNEDMMSIGLHNEPHPLRAAWNRAHCLHSDPQVNPPPEFRQIPDRQSAYKLIMNMLTGIKLSDKMALDIATYANCKVPVKTTVE